MKNNMLIRSCKKTLHKRAVQREMLECFLLNRYLQVLAPRHGLTYTHIPNGGLRSKKTASDLKRMGTKPGVWDYLLRKEGAPCVWLEMKYGRNTLTGEQVAWRDSLSPFGDVFIVAYSAEEAIEKLIDCNMLPVGCFKFLGANKKLIDSCKT